MNQIGLMEMLINENEKRFIQLFVDYIFIYIWDKVIFKLCLFLDYIIRRLINLCNRPKESERNIWMSK